MSGSGGPGIAELCGMLEVGRVVPVLLTDQLTGQLTLTCTRISSAWPRAPPMGWWIIVLECGSAIRLPRVPAPRMNEPIEAAMPTCVSKVA